MPIYIENESPIDVVGLTNQVGQVVSNATVTATIKRPGTEEEVWSGTLEATATPGSYETVVPDTVVFTLGEIVRIRYAAEAGSLNAAWYEDVRVRRRRP